MTRELQDEWVLASYNIHGCVGRDGHMDPERTASVLDELGADVLGLQEVGWHERLGLDPHQLDDLARRTGCEPIAGPTIRHPDGHYGNALLARGAILGIERHDLSYRSREPRGALDVRLEIRGGRARCLVTHLGLGPAERRFQIAALLDLLGADDGKPTFLLGDFNEWFPWARSRRRLRRRLGDIPMPATFPAWRPLFALDHVWARPRSALIELEAVDTPLTREASDHLPVRARVAVERDQPR